MQAISIFAGLMYGFLSMILVPVLLVFLNEYYMLPTYINLYLQVIGLFMIFGGGVLLVYSTSLFAKYGRGGSPLPFDPPKKLVTTGVYKYIRNPMFTASGLVWFGEFLLFGSVLLLPYALGWIIFNHIHLITQDEKWLENRYGDEYLAYKKKTARYIPHLY